jgi:hypothetical protein
MMDMETGEIQQKIQQGSLRIVQAMLWVATRKYHRKDIKTLDAVSELLDTVDDMAELSIPLMEAYQAGMPGVQMPDEDEEPKSNGSSSKASKSAKEKEGVTAE